MSIFRHMGVVAARSACLLRTTVLLYVWRLRSVCPRFGNLAPRMFSARYLAAGWLVAMAASVSCRPSDTQLPTPPGRPDAAATSAATTPAATTPAATPAATTSAAATTQSEKVREVWEISRIEGQKVGHARTRIECVRDERGEPLERIEMEQTVALARFGQQLRQTLRLVSWERPAGGLVRFESQVSSGGEWTLTRGQVSGGKLDIETATPGKTERQSLPWTEQLGGFFAVERLMRQPWKSGERRSVQALVPLLNQIGKTELQDAGIEALRIEGQSRSLRKIRRVDTVGAIKLESTHWIDDEGESVRSVSTFPPPGMETVRTDQAAALAEQSANAAFDLGAATRIPVANMPPDPHGSREIVYLAEIASGSIDDVFPDGPSQRVRKLDDRRAEVRVLAVRPTSASPAKPSDAKPSDAKLNATNASDPKEPQADSERPPLADAPTDDERLANGLVQSDDPAVVALAKQAVPDESDPWRLAIALESLVRRHVQPKQFSQAMATAAEVARSGEGDCTEHAVLLAAVCRARGLPARVAIGLVYAESLGGFAYHMWNEVWIDGQWIPLDATLARQGIGAGHLKLAGSSLRGADAFAALLPVVNVLGRLKLTVVQPR